jgi:excinuclease ABC subunit C
MQNIKTFLDHLPNSPGVYQMLGEKGDVIYVGKAKNLKKRVSSYFSGRAQDPKTLSLVNHIKDVTITVTNSENEAVLLECNLIKTHRPRYNILLRDDKSYPYIVLSAHEFPRIDIYRGKRKKNGMYFGPFPSAHAVRETINLLQKIFKLRTCRDAYYNARIRPCLLFQIDRCTAPCVGLVTSEEYAQQVKLAELFLQGKSNEVMAVLQSKMEAASKAMNFELAAQSRDQMTRLRQIQEKQYVSNATGNADVVGLSVQAGVICIQLLTIRDGHILGSHTYYPTDPMDSPREEILAAFLVQHYLSDVSHVESIPRSIILECAIPDGNLLENVLAAQANHKVEIFAPQRGEKKKWMEMAAASAKESLAAHLLSKTNMRERMQALRDVLQLPRTPKRIECFDISHSMGEAAVASCVVFDSEGPLKSDYRRFNISGITPGDDVAAMRQVIFRRFRRLQRDEAVMPDVILIDGGTTQLAAAHEAIDELEITSVLLVGVSKGPSRKPGFESIHIKGRVPMHLPATAVALHLIQQIRDEAHRFAITGHRARRDKIRTQSVLETIPGIGAKRRRELLRYFGGIQGIAYASLDEILKVPGISQSLAERIFATLHDTNP